MNFLWITTLFGEEPYYFGMLKKNRYFSSSERERERERERVTLASNFYIELTEQVKMACSFFV